MYDFRRHVTTLCAAATLALFSGRSLAWVESDVRSQIATVDVDRAGAAVITQDLTLAVRGGPLPGFELSGIDLDAEPLPGATVSSVSGSRAELAATPLLLDKRDDGTLRIEIDREKGIRTGVYLFRFQYRTNLLKRDLIRREGNGVEVRWIGPRFNQGIDSARVVFRLPAGPTPPSLPEAGTASGRIDDTDALGGVFIGNLHRLSDKDELDIVRPHISRGEPVLWRVRASAKAFDAFANPASASHAVKAQASHAISSSAQPRERLVWWLGALGLGLGYAWLLAGKWRFFSALCAQRSALARPLVRLPIGPRAAASGALLAAAFVSAAWFDLSTLGGLFLVLSMVLASQYAVPAKIVLRGPGQWLPLSEAEAFTPSTRTLPGRFLDAGTWQGLLVLAGVACALSLGARVLFVRAPYQALLLLLGSACLLPVFFTGRAAQLPADLANAPRPLLAKLVKRLRRVDGIKVVPWARIPDGVREADELRLLVQVPSAVRGLLGIEVGVEYGASASGAVATPFVLVRAREGSLAVEALPRELGWTRGRKADERAAILRPRLPTAVDCERLVLELANKLRDPNAPARPDGKRARVPGPGRVLSPAHVA